MKKNSMLLAFLFALFITSFIFCPGIVMANTDVGGTIGQDATWTESNSPYVVVSDISVREGVILTIEPGVIVKFNSYYRLTINGTLIANGTESQPIYFTPIKDDVGGDTNADGAASSPAAADWYNLHFTPTSVDNALDHVVIRYGGYQSSPGCTQPPACGTNLSIETSSLTVSNSIIEDGQNFGIWISNGSPTITNSVIRNHLYGLYLTSSDATITNNTISDNSYGISLVSSDATVTNNTISNNISGGIILNSSAATITGNTITGHQYPIGGSNFFDSIISGNNISGNTMQGIFLNSGMGESATLRVSDLEMKPIHKSQFSLGWH